MTPRQIRNREYRFAYNRRHGFNQQVFGYTFPPGYIHMVTQLLLVRAQIEDKEK